MNDKFTWTKGSIVVEKRSKDTREKEESRKDQPAKDDDNGKKA